MADVGDVDDVGELVALVRQRAPERVGEDIGAHIADVRIIIDRRPAAVDARLRRVRRITRYAGVDGLEAFEAARQAVEQLEGGGDRKGVVSGKSVCVWVDLGGGRSM